MEHDPNTPSRVRAQFNQAESDKIITLEKKEPVEFNTGLDQEKPVVVLLYLTLIN